MKNLITACLSLAALCEVNAQQIDLSRITPAPLKYLTLGNPGPKGKEIRINNLYMEQGGIPQLPVMGEFHYNRMNPKYWRDALLKMKASGIDIVATYCMWTLHEELEGEMCWAGHLDLRRFVQLCHELGLKVHLRFGPYCNAEIKNGGLPDWIVANKNLTTRSNDPLYLAYSRRWYQAVYNQVKGLLYKDGGPIMALQLENEFVKKGMIESHLTNLKRMAVEIGFDLPLYTMTHWMDSEYPKGEIVPYAGFYIEAPWTTKGKEEIATSNFEYFTYNRLSDNIGTDIIKIEGEVESMSGEGNESPFFTCEIGVGGATFYSRRAVIPKEMAAENIVLRLGCGANMMGYYMYTGGSNPVGKTSTTQSSGPRVNYDYQAPIRETGTLGDVMPEVKKYNYFMQDFGSALAPAISYLPTSNQKRSNLQWAVRSDGTGGYLFCSNYLYRHARQEYKNVQFSVKLKGETIRMPRKRVTIQNEAYFHWPFNQQLGNVQLNYATAQPICSMKEGRDETFFFFEDDNIPAEYLLSSQGIRSVTVQNGTATHEKKGYFVNQLTAGEGCVVEITKEDGSTVRLVTLTEAESNQIWKGTIGKREFVALTPSSLIYDNERITLIDNEATTSIRMYAEGRFTAQKFQAQPHSLKAGFCPIAPMAGSQWIKTAAGATVKRTFAIRTLSTIERAYLRYTATGAATCRINGQEVKATTMGNYQQANVTPLIATEANEVTFALPQGQELLAELEVLLKNGERILWNSDNTWTTADGRTPVQLAPGRAKPTSFAPEEHLALYEISTTALANSDEETRLYLSYKGDVANVYQNGQLMNDSFYDGTEWILSLNRLKYPIQSNPLLLRIDGLKSADAPIYFEKSVNPAECVVPSLSQVEVKQEYRFEVKRN